MCISPNNVFDVKYAFILNLMIIYFIYGFSNCPNNNSYDFSQSCTVMVN